MKKINFKIIILIIFALSISRIASASLFSISTEEDVIKTGGLFSATLVLDSESNSINTIEGDLVYDAKVLKPERVNIGSSFISFWVEPPTVSDSSKIHFSGMVPGGLSVSGREVFSVIFRAESVGDTTLSVSSANVYLSDGNGTIDKTNAKSKSIKITQGSAGDFEEINSKDNTAPQGFKIVRTHDNSLFDDKYFIVFGTQDKGTGLDHYDVCEYTKNNCKLSTSPYLLNYQNPFYRIIVRAYDVNGNMEEVILTSPLLMLAVIILIILILKSILFIYHRYLKKNRL